jgi:hypothetical protein
MAGHFSWREIPKRLLRLLGRFLARPAIYLGIVIALSVMLGRLFALHWRAGEPCRSSLCPNSLFVVICPADPTKAIHSLRELASVQNVDPSASSCAKNRSFWLDQRSGTYTTQPTETPREYEDLSFEVFKQSNVEQMVRVNYAGDRVLASWFKYAVRDGKIVPLESWVYSIFDFMLALSVVTAVSLFALRYTSSRRVRHSSASGIG